MVTYREQWKDPRWQRKRLEALEAAGWECTNCGDKETTLNVHHKRYIKGRMVWEYELDLLCVLCEPCHETEHADRALLDKIIFEIGAGNLDRIVGLVAGYMTADMALNPETANEAYESRGPWFELGMAASCLEFRSIDERRAIVSDLAAAGRGGPAISYYVKKWSAKE